MDKSEFDENNKLLSEVYREKINILLKNKEERKKK